MPWTSVSVPPTEQRSFSPPHSSKYLNQSQGDNPNILSTGTDVIAISSSSSGKKKRAWRRHSVHHLNDSAGGHTHTRHIVSASAVSAGNFPDAPDVGVCQSSRSLFNGSVNSDGKYDSDLKRLSSRDPKSEGELNLAEPMSVTGFTVASDKRNIGFHELFPFMPEGNYLIAGVRSLIWENSDS